MGSCCLSLLCEVLCEAAFEPIIICDDEKPIACSDRIPQIFEYPSKDSFLSKTLREIINCHFNPSTVEKNGVVCPASIFDLTFASIKNEDSLKTTSISRVKTWNIKGKKFYSIAIRDIPIITMANAPFDKERIPSDFSPLYSPIPSGKTYVDLELEPQLQNRLLNQFSKMADALPSLIWIVANTGAVLYQNSKVFQTFGVDTTTESWQECIHPDDIPGFIPQWLDGIYKGIYTRFEIRYRNKHQQPSPDGQYTWRWHFIQSTPILGPDGTAKQFVCNSVDVQALKEAEAEKQRLIASERMATEASKLKSAFLSMMSHEIRTPLFGIVGNTCLLLDTHTDTLQKEYIGNIDGSAKLMMSVIQDILDFSRIEAGKLRVLIEPFSFNRIINICVGMVQTAAKRKGLEFNITPLNEQVKAMGDSMRILQILTNLASNAIKFTSAGSVSIKFEHKLEKENKLSVKISVSDTGIGMSQELQDKLFTPWVQGDSSNRRLYGGSGLGLAISKSLLDMMGGEIGIISELGKGSCFWFRLTLPSLNPDFDTEGCRSPSSSPMGDAKFEFYNFSDVPSENTIENGLVTLTPGVHLTVPEFIKTDKTKLQLKLKPLSKVSKKLSKSKSVKKYRVLLAEDNPINQTILKRFLEKMGCVEYFLASDGQKAFDEYQSHPPRYYDIILLDQSMPKMDGDMVCRHIRQSDTEQIVISVSANALMADRNFFSSIGMNDHIPKPVDFNNFSNVLQFWFDKITTNPVT